MAPQLPNPIIGQSFTVTNLEAVEQKLLDETALVNPLEVPNIISELRNTVANAIRNSNYDRVRFGMLPPANTGFTLHLDSEGKLFKIDPILSAIQEVKPMIDPPNETAMIEDDSPITPNLPPNPLHY